MISNNKTELVYTSLILASTVATGGIALSFGPVPLTFQIFFVVFAGLFLPKNYSYLPMLIYIFLGAIGLPVFAGFSGGFEHLISPTGGYLIAFPIGSFIISSLHKDSDNFLYLFLISFLGILIVYLFGIFVLTFYTKSIALSLKIGFFPFILIDIIKLFISIFVYKRVLKALEKNR